MEKKLPNKDSSGGGSGDLATYSWKRGGKIVPVFPCFLSSLLKARVCVFLIFRYATLAQF